MPSLLSGRFELQRKLGEGTFADVWLAVDRQDEARAEVALKIFRPLDDGSGDWTPVLREVAAVLRMGPHPNVLRSRAVMKVVHFGDVATPCLLMDYVPGRNLALWLASLDPPSARDLPRRLIVMGGLLRGIAHAHSSGVVHHDISFGNVLVRDSDPPRALLTDFGSSLAEEPGVPRAPRESDPAELQPIYPPPYTCVLTLAEGARRDIYAFGTLCYLALTGRHPLTDQWQTMKPGQWAGLPSPHASLARRPLTDLSPWMRTDDRLRALSDLLLRCVSSDPNDRPESALLAAERWAALMGEPA